MTDTPATITKYRRIPRFLFRDILYTVDNLANAIAAEANGRCEESLLAIRLAEEFQRRPELIRFEMIASDAVGVWKQGQAAALAKVRRDGSIYCPALFVPVGRRKSCRMSEMGIIELTGWGNQDAKAAAGAVEIIRVVGERNEYRNGRISIMAEHGLTRLDDAETRFFGYVPKAEGDTPDIAQSLIDKTESEGEADA